MKVIRRLRELVICGAVLGQLSLPQAFASCDILEFHPADTVDGCVCTSNHCAGATKDVRNDRYYCATAPNTVLGQSNCQTQNVSVGTRYDCYEDVDNWALTYCIGTQVGCTIGAAGCAVICAAPPWAQCYLCLTGYAACEAAFVGGCAVECYLHVCYVDTDSARDIMRDVFLQFGGGQCTGGAS